VRSYADVGIDSTKSRIIPLRRHGESDDPVIQRLYDARAVHRVRQGVSLDPAHPTDTYDVYVIDYGWFLGLLDAGRIRAFETGLDPGARFADANDIEIRAEASRPRSGRCHRGSSRPAEVLGEQVFMVAADAGAVGVDGAEPGWRRGPVVAENLIRPGGSSYAVSAAA
jgi:hypothetical protein